MGHLELTVGLGFGRLAGRNTFANPLSPLSSKFDQREANSVGRGGTLGTINWFQGNAAAFYGLNITLAIRSLSHRSIRQTSCHERAHTWT